MSSIVESLIIAALGAAWATLCTLALRSDEYIQQTLESVLRSNRRPVTPETIAQGAPYLKLALGFGIVLGIVITVAGMLALAMGVATVLSGSPWL